MQHGITGTMPLGYYLSPEMNFIISLVSIGDRLVQLSTREMRKAQLYADLTLINLNLPARVYLPVLLSPDSPQHHVVRIPPQESVILNSKDRVWGCTHLACLLCRSESLACMSRCLS